MNGRRAQLVVARMSEATCGVMCVESDPGYRFAHPGYNRHDRRDA